MNKKKLGKKLLVASVSAVMALSVGILVYANTQALPDGTIITQGGTRFLADSKGEKYSGWFIDSKEDWYYFNESDQAMKTGWHHDDKDGYRYYLNLSDGKMATGWQTIEGKEYFFQPVRDVGNYHFNNEEEKWLYSVNSKVPYGAMYANTTTPDGSKVDSTGVKIVAETATQTETDHSSVETSTVKDGWVSENGSWHYYEGGTMAQNKWLDLDGKWYYVLSDGAMVSNTWKEIGGKAYYFGSDGGMYVNTTTPDGSSVDKNGVKINQSHAQYYYGDYVGHYVNVEDLSTWESYMGYNFEIVKIADGKIFGLYRQDTGAYSGFTADFMQGVPIENGSFVIDTRYEDLHSSYDPVKQEYIKATDYGSIYCKLDLKDGKPAIKIDFKNANYGDGDNGIYLKQ